MMGVGISLVSVEDGTGLSLVSVEDGVGISLVSVEVEQDLAWCQ